MAYKCTEPTRTRRSLFPRRYRLAGWAGPRGRLLQQRGDTGIDQLPASPLDLDAGTVHWRGELDKTGMEHTTLLTHEAYAALRVERVTRPAIGDAWLFPAPGDPDQPACRHLVRDWWERAAKLADLPKGKRLGWHSLRRQWATEMKETPLKDLCYMGGWKSPMTVLTCYQQPDTETQREALAKRKRYRAGARG
jgi:integrase